MNELNISGSNPGRRNDELFEGTAEDEDRGRPRLGAQYTDEVGRYVTARDRSGHRVSVLVPEAGAEASPFRPLDVGPRSGD